MNILLEALLVAVALTTPLWTVLLVVKFIEWQDERRQLLLKVHRNADGSLKQLEFKEGAVPQLINTP